LFRWSHGFSQLCRRRTHRECGASCNDLHNSSTALKMRPSSESRVTNEEDIATRVSPPPGLLPPGYSTGCLFVRLSIHRVDPLLHVAGAPTLAALQLSSCSMQVCISPHAERVAAMRASCRADSSHLNASTDTGKSSPSAEADRHLQSPVKTDLGRRARSVLPLN
jgi:hypothetical protein